MSLPDLQRSMAHNRSSKSLSLRGHLSECDSEASILPIDFQNVHLTGSSAEQSRNAANHLQISTPITPLVASSTASTPKNASTKLSSSSPISQLLIAASSRLGFSVARPLDQESLSSLPQHINFFNIPDPGEPMINNSTIVVTCSDMTSSSDEADSTHHRRFPNIIVVNEPSTSPSRCATGQPNADDGGEAGQNASSNMFLQLPERFVQCMTPVANAPASPAASFLRQVCSRLSVSTASSGESAKPLALPCLEVAKVPDAELSAVFQEKFEEMRKAEEKKKNSDEESISDSDENTNENEQSFREEAVETPVLKSPEHPNNLTCFESLKFHLRNTTIGPQSKWYLLWLSLIAISVQYNYAAIPFRAVFGSYYGTNSLPGVIPWLFFDYFCDLIYLADVLFMQPRMRYLHHGILEKELSVTSKNYMRKLRFKIDVLSLLPLDLLYFSYGQVMPIFRLPRLLKMGAYWEFFDRFDHATNIGAIIRIVRTLVYMLILLHIEASIYYFASEMEGFGTTRWSYPSQSDPALMTPYLWCLYFATKTSCAIPMLPLPTNEMEYILMILYWLNGLFVFAVLTGQIEDIVRSTTANKSSYRRKMDATLYFLKRLNVPHTMQEKIRTWFNYNWEQQKAIDETSLLEVLPTKLKTDLAISVHYTTLSKVKLFQDCDKTLISNLVLKLKPALFLPGDYVCRKGEVGTEMYIVKTGQVEVVGGENNSIIFATLGEGSVFGEISLMGVSGSSRRTADVRTKGFALLFTLSKADFEAAMRDYPVAHAMLKRRAKKILLQNKKKNDQIAADEKKQKAGADLDSSSDEDDEQNRRTPKLLQTVLQAVQLHTPHSRLLNILKVDSNNADNDHAPDTSKETRTNANEHEQPSATSSAKPIIAISPPHESELANNAETHDSNSDTRSLAPSIISRMSEESISLPSDSDDEDRWIKNRTPLPTIVQHDDITRLPDELHRAALHNNLPDSASSGATSNSTRRNSLWSIFKRKNKTAPLHQ